MNAKPLSYLLKENILSNFGSLELSDNGPIKVSGLEGSSLSALIAAQFLKNKQRCPQALIVLKDQKSGRNVNGRLAFMAPRIFP